MDESHENFLSVIIKKENFIEKESTVDTAQLLLTTFENNTNTSFNTGYVACDQKEVEVVKLKKSPAIETSALVLDPPTIFDSDSNHRNKHTQLLIQNNHVMESVDNISHYSPKCMEVEILKLQNNRHIEASDFDMDPTIIFDLDNYTNKDAQLQVENNQVMESVDNTPNYSPECIEMETIKLKNNHAIKTTALVPDPPIILDLDSNHNNSDAQLLVQNNQIMESVDNIPHYSQNCAKNNMTTKIDTMTTKISSNGTNFEEISEDEYRDTILNTESVSKAVRFYLSFNKIRWGRFSSLVLGITQGRLSVLLKEPKPWNQFSRRIQSYYSRMKYWLDNRATYIPKKKKELKISKNIKLPLPPHKQKKKSQEQYKLVKNNFDGTEDIGGLLLTHSNSQKLEMEESNEDTIAASFIAALNEKEISGKSCGDILSNCKSMTDHSNDHGLNSYQSGTNISEQLIN